MYDTTFRNEWKDFPKNPPSGGGNVDPMDVPAVLEIFSTSEGRWFVGLVVKQVGENGWMVWMVRLKKTSKTGTPRVWALGFFFGCEYFFWGRVFWEGEVEVLLPRKKHTYSTRIYLVPFAPREPY